MGPKEDNIMNEQRTECITKFCEWNILNQLYQTKRGLIQLRDWRT
jgi:hypothetical protein